MKKIVLLLVLTGLGGAAARAVYFAPTQAASLATAPAGPGRDLARLGEAVTLRAAARGNPFINLRDGREVLTAFTGATPAVEALQQNNAQPLAVAAADFDEDGVPDLIGGYAGAGAGILTLNRGNVDTIYPNSPEARQRQRDGVFTDSPFLSPARVFELPQPPDFLATGDFDADGHQDALAATRGGNLLYLLPGDGQGRFAAVRTREVEGGITALVCGDINRRDRLADIVIGIAATDGAQALIFGGPKGAIIATPEVIALPAEAAAFALGQLDGDHLTDLAIAAGDELLIVYGRDRKLYPDKGFRPDARRAELSRRKFPAALRSLAAGDFDNDRRTDLAALDGNGAVRLLTRRQGGKGKWQQSIWYRLPSTAAAQLARARVSSEPVDSLIILDPANRRVQVLAGSRATERLGRARRSAATLDVEGEPVAALPMRLNVDALTDLVVLRRGKVAPTVTLTSPMATFTVDNTSDSGPGSLRQAIIDANTMPGLDSIVFNITTASPSAPATINPLSPLPDITGGVTIDATTQPDFAGNPIIELNGAGAGPGANGLTTTEGNLVIRGLVINRFSGDGINMSGGGENTIESNFIGLNLAGTTALGNGGNGITLNASTITIGGAATSRNVISGNGGDGIRINFGATFVGVTFNFIGTDVTGTLDRGNTGSGISMSSSSNNVLNNVISGNAASGIVAASANSTIIQGNMIGTQADGTSPLGNASEGILIRSMAFNNTIGAGEAGSENTIAFNGLAGVVVVHECAGNLIQGNSIFSNAGLGIDLSADLFAGDGVTPNDPMDTDGGGNGLQNFPVLTSATSMGGSTTIAGTFNSTPSVVYLLHIYSSPSCDGSGNGEGQTFRGTIQVATDGSGNASFNETIPVGVPAGHVVTATATDNLFNTSEFSACVTVTGMGAADLQVTKSDSPDPVAPGGNITYGVSVDNSGPDAATSVTLSDSVPANTTFQSINTPAGWSCTTPPVGGTGAITCVNPSVGVGAINPFTIVVQVGAATPNGTVITNTATATSATPDPNSANNTATATTTVSTSSCQITCPERLIAAASANQCGAQVAYPAPTTTGVCDTVSCAPPAGAFFPVGETAVNCAVSGDGPSCSFNVTVLDNTPPQVSCPGAITAATTTGSSAVVDYPQPSVADNCPGATVTCVPVSGSSFPIGTTPVTCTGMDAAGNTSQCAFTVVVNEGRAPMIGCPPNIAVNAAPGQSSIVVTYPPPTVSGDIPGITVACVPPSGSAFPVGATNVACTATGSIGNPSTCVFTVTVNNIAVPRLSVAALDFGPAVSLPVQDPPAATFSIINPNSSPIDFTFETIRRTGNAVERGRIDNPDDSRNFTIQEVSGTGPAALVSLRSPVLLLAAQQRNYRIVFNPAIPAVAGGVDGLTAREVLPNVVTAKVTINYTGGGKLTLDLTARVAAGLKLIDPANPRNPPVVSFSRAGRDFNFGYSVFDSDLDVSRARYEFLDGSGQQVGRVYEVDLAAAIADADLVKGQSFTVEHTLSRVKQRSRVVQLRVTVSDGETSATAMASLSGSPSGTALRRRRAATVLSPPLP